jgi:non-ribosomal peptide synthetase component F
MLTHNSTNNFVKAMFKLGIVNASSVFLSVTTISFDIFVTEFWCTLLCGGKVLIANEYEQNNVIKISELCEKYNVNLIQTTPSRFGIYLSSGKYEFVQNLEKIILAGEPLKRKFG